MRLHLIGARTLFSLQSYYIFFVLQIISLFLFKKSYRFAATLPSRRNSTAFALRFSPFRSAISMLSQCNLYAFGSEVNLYTFL